MEPQFDIQQRAMGIILSTSVWGHSRKTKEGAAVVAREFDADPSRVSASKSLCEKMYVDLFQNPISRFKAYHYANTLPWNVEGMRVILCHRFQAYMAEFRKAAAEVRAGKEQFFSHWPEIRRNAMMDKVGLGGLFRDKDYPELSELKKKFRFEVSAVPLPVVGDAARLVDVTDEEREEIRRGVERSIIEGSRAANLELAIRFSDRLKKIAEKMMSNPSGAWHDTLLTNLADLCDAYPNLDIGGSNEFGPMIADLKRTILSYTPDQIKADEGAQNDVLGAAMYQLDVLSSWTGSSSEELLK